MVMLKGNVTNARKFIVFNECISSMRTLSSFSILEIKASVTKENGATGYKYIGRFIRKQVFVVNQA